MIDYRGLLHEMRRPRLLVRAARLGLADYRRDRDLRRIFGGAPPDSPEATLAQLLSAEAQAEATRREGDARYSFVRHIDLLVALLAEARLQRQA